MKATLPQLSMNNFQPPCVDTLVVLITARRELILEPKPHGYKVQRINNFRDQGSLNYAAISGAQCFAELAEHTYKVIW